MTQLRRSWRWRVGSGISLGVIAVIVGCAEGSEITDGLSIEADNVEADGAVVESDGAPRLPTSPPSTPSPDGGGVEDASGDAVAPRPDAGPDAGPPPPGCAAINTCAGGTDLGQVSGDIDADTKTAQGTSSQWLQVRVVENNHSFFGIPLSARVNLASPPGTNFDLYVYVAGGATGQECSTPAAVSTSTGTDTVRPEWGELGIIPNGNDDSRTLSIEVRHVSGTCAPGAKWTLTVLGNTL